MTKRNILNENNEVVNELETTIETTEIHTEVVATVTDPAPNVVNEPTPVETTNEPKNTLLRKHVCDLEQGLYHIEIQLIDTEEHVIVPVNIIPSRRFGDMNVSDYIVYYLTSELKYKRFTIVSMN